MPPTRTSRLAAASVARIALTLSAGLLGACVDSTVDLSRAAAAVLTVSGSDQYVTAGGSTSQPLVAQVLASDGLPFAGASVAWTLTSGSGALSDSLTLSDADGHAEVSYVAGESAGSAVVTATLENGATTSFTLRVLASSAAPRRLPPVVVSAVAPLAGGAR